MQSTPTAEPAAPPADGEAPAQSTAETDEAERKPEPAAPRKMKAGRRQSGLPEFLPGGLPVHEMHTVAYTMLKGALDMRSFNLITQMRTCPSSARPIMP